MNSIFIHSASLVFPHIYTEEQLSSHFNNGMPVTDEQKVTIPASDFLPSRVKRRMSRLTQMVIHTTYQAREVAGLLDTDLPLILGTANGEIEAMGSILQTMFSDPPYISPSLFHNSVHNTAAGYWSILGKKHQGSTTITAGDLTGEYSLLDAISRLDTRTKLIQLTAGDEAITIPRWADPDHCSIDFCSSLILTSLAELPCLGRIRHLNIYREWDNHSFGNSVATWKPDRIYTNLPDLPETLPLPQFTPFRHPLEFLLAVITPLLHPQSNGRILILRRSAQGSLAEIVLEIAS